MLRFGSVLVNADSHVSGEGDAGDKVSDENILLVDEVHVEEVGEWFHVENRDYVGINVNEEGEGGRNIGAEHGALVFLHSLSEEALWLLEPEVVKPIRDGAQQREPVASRNLPDRKLRRSRRRYQRRRWQWHGGGGEGKCCVVWWLLFDVNMWWGERRS